MDNGLIHIYYGDSKGKTTASVGLAIRAIGHGKRVLFTQFLKGSETGEIPSLDKLGVHIIRSEKNMGFLWKMSSSKIKDFCKEQERIFSKVKEAISGDKPFDVLVLDEALDAMESKMLDENVIREFIINKPAKLEVILTGRSAPRWLKEKADYVTEMKKHKHPFDKGIDGRKAIEF